MSERMERLRTLLALGWSLDQALAQIGISETVRGYVHGLVQDFANRNSKLTTSDQDMRYLEGYIAAVESKG